MSPHPVGRIENKTCFIAGAAQGIGCSAVEACLREGARVIAADVQAEKLAQLASHNRMRVITLDVTDSAAVTATARAHPDVSVLINCAGFVAAGTILDCTDEILQRSFQINVAAMFNTIRAFIPAMLERHDGSIVNIASVVSSIKAAPERCAYATTKAAVIGLTKAVARDFISQGIRCNAISPGTVLTPSLEERMSASGDSEAAKAAFISRQPIGRLGSSAEIAAVIVMLASDEARFMTGANIVIDGGMSL